jgi:dipeptide/tripeptide permease
MAIGQFMMTFESLFFLALLTLILGNGAFKPNISTQVGGLYAPGDPRRDRAYSIFYVGINVGAFLAPLVSGTLGEKLGWRYGFAAAGVGCSSPLRCISTRCRCCQRTSFTSQVPPGSTRGHLTAANGAPSER